MSWVIRYGILLSHELLNRIFSIWMQKKCCGGEKRDQRLCKHCCWFEEGQSDKESWWPKIAERGWQPLLATSKEMGSSALKLQGISEFCLQPAGTRGKFSLDLQIRALAMDLDYGLLRLQIEGPASSWYNSNSVGLWDKVFM